MVMTCGESVLIDCSSRQLDLQVRTWSLVIVRVESSRESRDKGHLDEENDGVQQRLYKVKCRQRQVALKV